MENKRQKQAHSRRCQQHERADAAIEQAEDSDDAADFVAVALADGFV